MSNVMWLDDLSVEREVECIVPVAEDYLTAAVDGDTEWLVERRKEQAEILAAAIERARYAERRVRELTASVRYLEDLIVAKGALR